MAGRALRVVVWVVGLIVAVVLGAVSAVVLYARTDGGRARVRALVVAQARRALPGLDIGRVGGDYIHEITLEDVTVLDRAGRRAIHVDRISIHPDLPQLLRRTVAMRELLLERPTVVARTDDEGTLNLATLGPREPSPREPGGAVWRLRGDHVRIVEGAADILPAGGARTRLSDVGLEGAASYDEQGLSALVHALGGRVEREDARGRVDVRGRLEMPSEAGGGLTLGEYSAALEASGLVAGERGSLKLEAHGSGVPLAPGTRASVLLETAPARIAGLRIGATRIRATSDGRRWRIPRTVVRAPGARLAFEAHGTAAEKLDMTADLDARRVATGTLRVDEAKLTARISAHRPRPGAGLADAAIDVRARGNLTALAAGGVAVRTAKLDARLGGRLGSPHGTFRFDARGVSAQAVPRIDVLTVTADGDGRALHLRAAATGPGLGAELAAHGQLGRRHSHLTIDRGSLRGSFRLGTGRRRQALALALAKPVTIDVQAGDRIELGPAELRGTGDLFNGSVTASGNYRLRARRGQPLAEVRVQLARAAFAGLDPVDARLEATLGARQVQASVEAQVGGAHLQLRAAAPVTVPRRGPPRLAPSGDVDVRLETKGLRLSALPILQRRLARAGLAGGTLDASVTVSGDIARPEAKAHVDVRDVTITGTRGLGRDVALRTLRGLAASVNVETRAGALAVAATLRLDRAEVLRLQGESRIHFGALVAGRAPPFADTPWNGTIELPKLELESLATGAGPLAGVKGTLAGRIAVAGTPRRPSGRGDITISDARVDEIALSKVQLHAEAMRDHVVAALDVAEAGGGDLHAQARLRLDQGRALDARADARGVDIGFMRPFFTGLRELGGKLQASVQVTGKLTAPELGGSASLKDGRIGIIGQPTFRDIAAEATMSAGRIDLTALSARSGDGKLTAKGWVRLEAWRPQALVLQAHADDFVIAVGGKSGPRINGDLAFEAARRDAVLAGTAEVPNAVVWLPELSAGGGGNLQPLGPRPDVHFVDAAGQAAASRQSAEKGAAPKSRTRVDLRANAGPVYVRGPDLNLELESHLHLETVGTGADARAALSGQVRIRRGHVNLSGQRFDVERGDVTFDGSPEPNPALDIRLTRQFPEALVAIEVRGTLSKPQLNLISDPPIYDKAQIASLILTGQAGAQAAPGGKAFDATGMVATLLLGQIAGRVAPEIGIDVLRVGTVEERNTQGTLTGQIDTRVEVGKYVSERIYVSYAHVFGASENTNTNEAHVEYRVSRHWVIETIFGDAGVGSVDALWTYRY